MDGGLSAWPGGDTGKRLYSVTAQRSPSRPLSRLGEDPASRQELPPKQWHSFPSAPGFGPQLWTQKRCQAGPEGWGDSGSPAGVGRLAHADTELGKDTVAIQEGLWWKSFFKSSF